VNVPRWPKADEQWYLGVQCKKCRMPILFALDRSEGGRGDQLPLARRLVLTCTLDTCRHQADYSAASVSRFRKPPVKPPAESIRETGKSRKQKLGA
jgi:hypothetical protein